MLCLTENPQGELSISAKFHLRMVPVFTLKEALYAKELLNNEDPSISFGEHEKTVAVDGFNKSNVNANLYAVVVEDNTYIARPPV